MKTIKLKQFEWEKLKIAVDKELREAEIMLLVSQTNDTIWEYEEWKKLKREVMDAKNGY